jgi:nitrate/TMAO reductase-like tetraheme cytochrome c subunit
MSKQQQHLQFYSNTYRTSLRLFLRLSLISLFLLSFNATAEDDISEGAQAHGKILSEEQFPSASKCAPCHKKVYDEWSSSAHAYSGLSPMFHKFENAINSLAPTINSFCVRCHQSVGTTIGEKRESNLWDRVQVSREGVTCITCHRVNTEYGKVNGERRIEPGDIFQPVYGPTDAVELQKVLDNPGEYKITTSADESGQQIHTKAIRFEQIRKSEFCVSCHQVAVNLGIKLEVVWDQYRASPANKQGVTCQQCHMGRIPGVPSGFERAPVAVVDDKEIEPNRDHYNHGFYGPGYSIAHPGIFPHNPDAQDWTIEEWLTFNYRAGWGTEEFEDTVSDDYQFPEVWEDMVDRETAREIIDANLAKLEIRKQQRKQVMEMGTHIDGPFFDNKPKAGSSLKFHYVVKNINIGHNVPSGSLGAQPELWLNVALVDPNGKTVWESGYVDSNGDMADLHSLDVRAGKIEHDSQLFNLQTKFLTTNVKGTDREMYLPVNFDVDQLPFLRPAQQPVSVMNHPPFVRMEGRSIPPLGERKAKYKVPARLMKQKGQYKLAVRMRSRAEPIYFMNFVGATDEMERAMNEGMLDIHPYTVEFTVK